MSEQTLEQRFAAALRRELGMADAGAPASVLTVRAPDVNIAPRIVAEMPAMDAPLEIQDVDAGTFGTRLKVVKRDAEGRIDEVMITPETFYPLGQFR